MRALTQFSRDYAVGWGFINETPPSGFYNLPLVLAYSALDNALSEFITQGTFGCVRKNGKPCFGLKEKMRASRKKGQLKWIDYDRVVKGQKARNEVAHETKLHDKKVCLEFIDAIEVEFKNWSILP